MEMVGGGGGSDSRLHSWCPVPIQAAYCIICVLCPLPLSELGDSLTSSTSGLASVQGFTHEMSFEMCICLQQNL